MDITADPGSPAEPAEIPGDPLALERQVCFALSIAAKELIEMLQLDGPTLSPMLKRLEAAGLVTRTRDPDDERQLRIDLTEQGRALREQALNVPPAVVAKLGMSLGELMELQRGLTDLNEAPRRAGVQPAPAPAKDSI